MNRKECCDYDVLAGNYDEVRGHKADFIMYWTSQLAYAASIGDTGMILDIGCGTGSYIDVFSTPDTRTVIGLDLSRQMLLRAREKLDRQNVNVVQGDTCDLPFKKNKFDTAFMILMLHHVPDGSRPGVYSEVFSVLKPGGRLAVMTRSPEHIRESLIALFPGVIEIDCMRMPDIEVLKSELAQAGFDQVESHEMPNHTIYRNREQFIQKVGNRYISTLSMFDDRDFKKRFSVFKKRLENKFGTAEELYDPLVFTIVVAQK